VGCPRARRWALLLGAVPVLGKNELPRADQRSRGNRSPGRWRILGCLPAGSGFCRSRILPDVGGVTLLWHDRHGASARGTRTSSDAKAPGARGRGRERRLWEWDLEGRSSTSRGDGAHAWPPPVPALIVVPGNGAPVGRGMDPTVSTPTTSFSSRRPRAHLSRQDGSLQHEHRIRHEDGTYGGSWPWCRGARPGRRSARIAGSAVRHDDANDRAGAGSGTQGSRPVGPGSATARSSWTARAAAPTRSSTARAASGFAALISTFDRFKVVNDSSGHPVGDELLTRVAAARVVPAARRRLARLARRVSPFSCTALGDEQQANAWRFRSRRVLEAPLLDRGREYSPRSTASASVCPSTPVRTNHARRDIAMYNAKGAGKARMSCRVPTCTRASATASPSSTTCGTAVSRNDFECTTSRIVSLGI